MAGEVTSLAPSAPGLGPSITRLEGGGWSVKFFVPGKPVPKGRPRGRVVQRPGKRGFVQFYTDSSTVEWESRVAAACRTQLESLDPIPTPFEGRCVVFMRFNLEKPKSTPKAVTHPVKSRADVDNLAKAVLDAMQNAGVLGNDNIVTDLTVIKRYSDADHPLGVEIELAAF